MIPKAEANVGVKRLAERFECEDVVAIVGPPLDALLATDEGRPEKESDGGNCIESDEGNGVLSGLICGCIGEHLLIGNERNEELESLDASEP